MSESAADEVEVLAGRAGSLRWAVFCSADSEAPGYLYTMLRVWSGDEQVVAGSGFGGPRLPAGQVLTDWRGRTDGLPYFVMARTAPEVTRLVATTDRGLEVELTLSGPVARYGLRFAAAGLPDGHGPASLRAETAGGTYTTAQRVPPWRPPGSAGSGRPG